MKVLYLPGFSLKNKAELELFQKYFTKKGADFYSHQWAHWKDESVEWDVEAEIKIIQDTVQENNFKKFVLIAKSIGTYVGSKLILELNGINNYTNLTPDYIKPTLGKPVLSTLGEGIKVRFMGIPVKDSDEEFLQTYKNAISNLPDVKIFQNEQDKYGSFDEIVNLLGEFENVELIKIPYIKNHEYFISEMIWESL